MPAVPQIPAGAESSASGQMPPGPNEQMLAAIAAAVASAMAPFAHDLKVIKDDVAELKKPQVLLDASFDDEAFIGVAAPGAPRQLREKSRTPPREK